MKKREAGNKHADRHKHVGRRTDKHRHSDRHRDADRRRDACRQAIERVLAECDSKVGFEPHNLVYFCLRVMKSDCSAETLDEAIRTLKGYFVWESHVVTATKAEVKLTRGHRAVRGDSFERVWSPMKLLKPISKVLSDSALAWQDEPHVVVLGDEVFSVTRATNIAFACTQYLIQACSESTYPYCTKDFHSCFERI